MGLSFLAEEEEEVVLTGWAKICSAQNISKQLKSEFMAEISEQNKYYEILMSELFWGKVRVLIYRQVCFVIGLDWIRTFRIYSHSDSDSKILMPNGH